MARRQRSVLSLGRRHGRALAGLVLAAGLFLAAAFVAAPRAEETDQLLNVELVRRVTEDAVRKMMSDLPPTGKRVRVRVEPYHEAGWLVQDLVGKTLRARGCEVVQVPLTPGAAPPAAAAPQAAAAAQGAPPPSGPPSGAAAAGAAIQAAQGMAPPDTAGALVAGAAPADSIAGAGEAGSAAGAAEEATSAAGGGAAPPEKSKAEIVPVDAELDLRVVELGLRYTDTHRSFPLFGDTKVERYALTSLHAELRGPDDPVVRWSGGAEAKVIDEVSKDDLAILEGQRYPFTAPALPAQGASRWVEPLIVSAIVVGLVFLFVSNKS